LGGGAAGVRAPPGWFLNAQHFGKGTTPALRATPPNLGGEFGIAEFENFTSFSDYLQYANPIAFPVPASDR
jgi:hypothetical protein